MARGEFERAARLFGAASVLRDAIGLPLAAYERSLHEQWVTAMRAQLGEAGLGAAFAAGRAMPLELAIAYALGGGTDD